MTQRYALIGASGYVAPRHLAAIKATGGELVVAFDINDSVGVMDQHFPDAAFFTEFERFAAFVHEEQRSGRGIDYVSICSPNYLHRAHIEFALLSRADVICEKPLVLEPADLDHLAFLEKESDRNVYSILQLRLHLAIIELKKSIEAGPKDKIHEVDLTYITSRGAWYYESWKGAIEKSGGIATNIGVHFYDMLSFLFGSFTQSIVHHRSADSASGYLELDRAKVRWMLSINRNDLPPQLLPEQKTFRSIAIDGAEIEFSNGFTDLHTSSYQQILHGKGFGLEAVRPSIELVADIRNAPIENGCGEKHPLLGQVTKR